MIWTIIPVLCSYLLVSSKHFLVEIEDKKDPQSSSRTVGSVSGNNYGNNGKSSSSRPEKRSSESSSSLCCGLEHDCVGGTDYIFNGKATKGCVQNRKKIVLYRPHEKCGKNTKNSLHFLTN